jgi:hypothetical protein
MNSVLNLQTYQGDITPEDPSAFSTLSVVYCGEWSLLSIAACV